MNNTIRPKYSWGTQLWGLLHTITIFDFEENVIHADRCLQMLRGIADIIPCPKCANEYREHLEALKTVNIYESLSLFKWSVDLHNKVNQKLEKPVMSYEDALKIWARII